MTENGMKFESREADVDKFSTSILHLHDSYQNLDEMGITSKKYQNLTAASVLICAARESSQMHQKYSTLDAASTVEPNSALKELRNDLAAAKEEIRHLTTVQIELQVWKA